MSGSLCAFSCISNCSIYVAMLCAFLLGFGDSCFNTQVSATLSYIGVLKMYLPLLRKCIMNVHIETVMT